MNMLGRFINKFVYYGVMTCCIIGIMANLLVLYVVRHASKKIGNFKYLLMVFSIIEFLFAVVVLLANPFAYAYDYRLIIFSHSIFPFISKNILGKWLVGLYCTFYELWMGIVVVLFSYKYIVLCRKKLTEKISRYWYYKLVVLLIYTIHLVYSLFCGLVLCLGTDLPENVSTHVAHALHRSRTENYLVLTFTEPDCNFTIKGFIAVMDHIIFSTLTGTIVLFCGRQIWKAIIQMYEDHDRNYKSNLQLFYTLTLQAAVPFVLYQIPTCIVLASALLEKVPLLTDYIPIWILCLSLAKVIDPFIILMLIKDYRSATCQIFRANLLYLANKLPHRNHQVASGSQHLSSIA